MPLSQGRSRLRRSIFFFSLISGLLPTGSYASFTWVSLGMTYPTPLGTVYQTLDRNLPIGLQAEAGLDATWLGLGPSFQFQLTGVYHSLAVRGFSSINIGNAYGF